MSTSELRQFVDRCTEKERSWLKEYLLTEGESVPELKLSRREAADLARRVADINAGRNCVRFKDVKAVSAWLDRGAS
jgi:hypothetical protein